MKEPLEPIRSNIRLCEALLKVDSPAYAREDVQRLLTAAKAKLRRTGDRRATDNEIID